MLLSEFSFEYPPELIAQEALEPRDASRMMLLHRSRQSVSHGLFKDLPSHFKKGELLVLNNTKVLPARLFARKKTGGRVEVLMIAQRDGGWHCLISPAKSLEVGSSLFFSYQSEEVEAKLIEDFGRIKVLQFPEKISVRELMRAEGAAPLPPYIRRESSRVSDLERYQSIYAQKEGAIAAPTAGLHFTEQIFKELREKGVEIHFITLHVGIGTFEPIRVDHIEDHVMQTEYHEIPDRVLEALLKAKQEGRPITAVGTTGVRSLESYYRSVSKLPSPLEGEGARRVGEGEMQNTNLFITPGYKFKIVDRFLTNFHQPCSTPLLLTSAFAGKEFLFRAYEEAIIKKYRLFSYGDCMLIL